MAADFPPNGVAEQLEKILSSQTLGAPAPGAGAGSRPRWEKLAWGIAGLCVLTTVTLGVAYWRQSHREGEILKLSILPPAQGFIGQPANISPDGRMLAFLAPVENLPM